MGRIHLPAGLLRAGGGLAAAAGPVIVLAGLALTDLAAQDERPFGGLLAGMALAIALGLTASWLLRPLRPTQAAWLSAGHSVLEGVLGVVLVFVVTAPLALLLPASWAERLVAQERATEWMLLMMMGVALTVAARAWGRAARSAAARAESERDAANSRARLAERERELLQTELQLLRAQVEPHFLWNTLGALGYLIRHDTGRAERMLELLITYLRSTVVDRRGAAATLGVEFAAIETYLQLMQLRMGGRLRFELALPAELRGRACPALLIQPLVENAIKHGLEPQVGPARLSVRAEQPEPGRVRLVIHDNGVGLQAQAPTAGTGLGLRNIRDRLRLLYGDEASLRIAGTPEGGVRAQVEWPLEAQ